ncbi:MAG: hypothetical protein AAF719_05555 [Pseudomonadota bacterium]
MNPYSLQHKVGRHLRAKGAPPWEVAEQFGHKRPDVSTTEIYAPFDPAYLSNAVRVIDDLLKEVLMSPEQRPITLPEPCPNSAISAFSNGANVVG